jgi:hypothetical protein
MVFKATAAAAAGLSILLLLSLLCNQAAAQIPNAEALNFASYQPINVTCPSRSLLRNTGTAVNNNQSINPNEALYIEQRRQNEVASAFQTFLANNITGYDLDILAPNASYCEFFVFIWSCHALHSLADRLSFCSLWRFFK